LKIKNGRYMKTTTVRINDNTLGRIDGLATTLSRSRSWIINQAIERFIDYEELKKKMANSILHSR